MNYLGFKKNAERRFGHFSCVQRQWLALNTGGAQGGNLIEFRSPHAARRRTNRFGRVAQMADAYDGWSKSQDTQRCKHKRRHFGPLLFGLWLSPLSRQCPDPVMTCQCPTAPVEALST